MSANLRYRGLYPQRHQTKGPLMRSRMLTARQLMEKLRRALDAAQYSYPDAMIAELGCLYDGACAAVTLEEMQQVADCWERLQRAYPVRRFFMEFPAWPNVGHLVLVIPLPARRPRRLIVQ